MTDNQRVVVFVGPTISPEEARRIFPEAALRTPVARGDVLQAALERSQAICVIDGYFEHRLSVHHKEILWALKQGIAVYGAASMGALRAAELDVYGMVGVGSVYRSFASEQLENDDEVAIVHGPAPDFRAGSDALVNMRATLACALAEAVITADERDALVRLARQTFYPERSFARLLADAETSSLPIQTHHNLRRWLSEPGKRIDQKRLDAEELLRTVRDELIGGRLRTTDALWDFPCTSAWMQLWNDRDRTTGASTEPMPDQAGD